MNEILKDEGNERQELPVISFNQECKAIEIVADDGHFLLSPLPSMKGTFGTAKWMAERSEGWKLPSEDEIEIINDYLSEINEVLLVNNYPTINEKEKWWIDECHITTSLIDISWAKYCPLSWHHIAKNKIDDTCEFRLIKPIV